MAFSKWISTTILAAVIFAGFSPWMSPVTSTAGEDPAAGEIQKVVALIPPDFPPTYFREPNDGKASGLAVDVMNELARMCGFEMEYRFAQPWEEIETMLLSGQANLIPFRVINEKTKQRFIFTRTLDTSPVNFIARASQDTSMQYAPGMRVGSSREAPPRKS
jgi:ABC-type amino acid transport substrate-binding protein